jgi:DNA polymerase-3 subunit delta'
VIAHPWHRAVLGRLLADRGRMPHALLVHGPRGIGKAELARALAASLLCESPKGGLACGTCPSCHWFSQGNHPDYRELVPEAAVDEPAEASEADTAAGSARKSVVIKVEQVRDQADFMTLSTHRAGFRVLVIRPAEAMHPAAANALLKTLEEPAPASAIVLVSDRPAHVLPTIRSRCRDVGLGIPERGPALAWLREQGIEEPEAALARAGGAPLLARDLASPEEAALRKRVMTELTRPEGMDPLAFGAAVDREGLERTIYWMQTWVQDLVRARAHAEVRFHVDLAAAARGLSRSADPEALFELDRALASARALVSHPLNPRLVAEHLAMAYNRATSGHGP